MLAYGSQPGVATLLPQADAFFPALVTSVVPAKTLHSPAACIGTEFFARREKIEVTPHSSRFERSPVPIGPAHRPSTRAVCARPRRMP